MPPRKGHKKTRTGCVMCKQRRIKCDETRPECKNCTQRGGKVLLCTYKYPSPRRQAQEGGGVVLPQQGMLAHSQLIASTESELATALPNFSVSLPPSFNLNQAENSFFRFNTHSESTVTRRELCATCGCWHARMGRLHFADRMPGTLPGCALIELFPDALKVELREPSNSSSSSSIVFKDKSLVPNYSEADLFLLNRFISHTWETLVLSGDEDTRHVWAQVVPTLSLAHPLLLHSMLVVTAAHLGRTPTSTSSTSNSTDPRPDRLYTDPAGLTKLEETHFTEAMAYFGQEILDGIDELNCHAVFVATSILVLYLVSPRRHPASNLHHLDTSWAFFLRALYGALQHSWNVLSRGPVSILVDDLLPARTSTQVLSQKAETVLGRLSSLCSDFNILGAGCAAEMADRTTAGAYFDAVWNIRMTWAVLEWYCASIDPGAPSGTGQADMDESPLPVDSAEVLCALFQFVLQTPARFWERLEMGSPRALIIYAYLTVCWEVVSYGAEMENVQGQGENIWHRWTRGRAEADLKCLEMRLNHVAGSDEGKGVFKLWMGGAWDVYMDLRKGCWFRSASESEG